MTAHRAMAREPVSVSAYHTKRQSRSGATPTHPGWDAASSSQVISQHFVRLIICSDSLPVPINILLGRVRYKLVKMKCLVQEHCTMNMAIRPVHLDIPFVRSFVRPFVRPSVHPSVRLSIRSCIHSF